MVDISFFQKYLSEIPSAKQPVKLNILFASINSRRQVAISKENVTLVKHTNGPAPKHAFTSVMRGFVSYMFGPNFYFHTLCL